MSQDFYSSGYAAPQDQYNMQYGYSPGQGGQDQYNQQYAAPPPQQPDYNQQPEYSQQQDYSQQQPQNDFYNPQQAQQPQYDQYAASPQYNNQSFDQNTSNDFYSGSFYNPASPASVGGSMGSMGGPGVGANTTNTSTSFEDEPPLMEELGIDIQQIYQTTMTVLNPNKPAATNLMDDPDLSGPLIFCLGFGALLLFSGKLHFGYIYGVALVGAAAIYTLLNLMSVNGVSVAVTVSVLGYCMLPMCFLSGLAALISLKGFIGIIVSLVVVSWSAFSSSKLFVSVLAMYDQQPLVAYPCALMYGVFAVLAVF